MVSDRSAQGVDLGSGFAGAQNEGNLLSSQFRQRGGDLLPVMGVRGKQHSIEVGEDK
jgi:hypothetical protein